MNPKENQEIADWFETFLKVVCWNYELEPLLPYHDLAAQVVECLEPKRKGIPAEIAPWREEGDAKRSK